MTRRMSMAKKREYFLKLLDSVSDLASKKIPENFKKNPTVNIDLEHPQKKIK